MFYLGGLSKKFLEEIIEVFYGYSGLFVKVWVLNYVSGGGIVVIGFFVINLYLYMEWSRK